MEKTLEHLKDTLEDEIKKIVKKGDITPAELESVQKAVCTIDMIDSMGSGQSQGMMDSYGSYRGYSRNHMPMRDMYGDYHYDGYAHDTGYHNRSYGSYGYEGDSYRRGRSPVTGRYISRDAYPAGRSYDNNYSGHSIMDRMVAKLESMYDEAQTDRERQTVDQWIQRLRNNN